MTTSATASGIATSKSMVVPDRTNADRAISSRMSAVSGNSTCATSRAPRIGASRRVRAKRLSTSQATAKHARTIASSTMPRGPAR